MKINLPSHKIAESSQAGLQDIPLAYIDTKDTQYEAQFKLEYDFAHDSKKVVRAYDTIDVNNLILFDENGVPIKDAKYRRQGNLYYYEPPNAQEFKPTTFTCSALIQRQMKYQSSNTYDLKIGVAERTSNYQLSPHLISVFGDAYRRGKCPSNIMVNGGAMTSSSLINAADMNADFIFLRTDDGLHFAGIDINALIDNHINLWISATAWGKAFQNANRKKTFVKEGNLNSFFKDTNRTRKPELVFNQKTRFGQFPATLCTYSYPYEDVLLIEYPEKAFIVVTQDEFLDNCGKNSKIIYDVLMHIYLKAYYKSNEETSWITDESVDYVAYSRDPLKLQHKKINLKKMLSHNGYDIKDEYKLIGIETSDKNVKFTNMAPNKDLFFQKAGNRKKADPQKPEGYISYLTTRSTVVLYKQRDVFMLTTKASLTSQSIPNGCQVIIGPVHDSKKCIYTDENQVLDIPDITMVWYICTPRGNAGTTNTFSLVEQGEYSMNKHGYKIAEVRVIPKYDINLIDVRTPGGGLPAMEQDVYSLMDIGNVYGRPYRVGSTLIIRLPYRLKPYEDKIMNAVKQHIVAGEYPVLIFE